MCFDYKNRRESQQAAAADLGTRIAGVGAESSPAHQLTPAHQSSPSTTPVNVEDSTPSIKTPVQPSTHGNINTSDITLCRLKKYNYFISFYCNRKLDSL